jgi:predicted ATPase/transcriptional regulator with XRE-family HTH domain
LDEELTFGQWLRRSRKARDLTQTELARRISCALGTIRKLEADELRPSKELAVRLATYFGVPEHAHATFVAYARGQADTPLQPVREKAAGTAPATKLASDRHNLPIPATALIGRTHEVAAVCILLRRSDVRLLVLTGPGGVGKTRLAFQVASELVEAFADGVWFVNLAPVRDPALVVPTIAQTLGLNEGGSRQLLERLQDYLRQKQLLLLLDNFEHVLSAAPCISELLAVAPALKVLITSRAVLHLSGEQEFSVPPLALPDRYTLPSLETLTQYDAVALFLARAQAVRPDFHLTDANALAVVDICHQLDGLPLAIELGTARLKLLHPSALSARLKQRLPLLTGGPRDLPSRQQTLRSTIDWSYHLLEPGEQTLFRRLAVFVGGWTLEAAEEVCNATGDLPMTVLDGLAALLDQSLVQQAEEGGRLRFSMLETIREYALVQLEVSGEAAVVRRQHAAYYVALVERPAYGGRRDPDWFEQMERELGNRRAVIEWALVTGEVEPGLRLLIDVPFWGDRSSEGRRWLQELLALPAAASTQLRADAFMMLAGLAFYQHDYRAAHTAVEQQRPLAQTLGDPGRLFQAALCSGWINLGEGDYATARACFEEAQRTIEGADDQKTDLWIPYRMGKADALAWAYYGRGTHALASGDLTSASSLFHKALVFFQAQPNNPIPIVDTQIKLGYVAQQQGNAGEATRYLLASLALTWQLRYKRRIVAALMGLAGVACSQEQATRAARLFGAATALNELIGAPYDPDEHVIDERNIAATQAHLGEAVFKQAWAEGWAMPIEQAVAYALEAC